MGCGAGKAKGVDGQEASAEAGGKADADPKAKPVEADNAADNAAVKAEEPLSPQPDAISVAMTRGSVLVAPPSDRGDEVLDDLDAPAPEMLAKEVGDEVLVESENHLQAALKAVVGTDGPVGMDSVLAKLSGPTGPEEDATVVIVLCEGYCNRSRTFSVRCTSDAELGVLYIVTMLEKGEDCATVPSDEELVVIWPPTEKFDEEHVPRKGSEDYKRLQSMTVAPPQSDRGDDDLDEAGSEDAEKLAKEVGDEVTVYAASHPKAALKAWAGAAGTIGLLRVSGKLSGDAGVGEDATVMLIVEDCDRRGHCKHTFTVRAESEPWDSGESMYVVIMTEKGIESSDESENEAKAADDGWEVLFCEE